MIAPMPSREMQVQALWRALSAPLAGFIFKRVGDAQAAEDILQDVFLHVHQHLEQVRDPSRIESWLYQITRNAIADYYRHREPVVPLTVELAAETNDDDPLRRVLAISVRRMIECLPEEYRIPLWLDMVDGVPQAEIAARLGLSLSGAKSRVQRARAKLRALLFECCHFEFDRTGRVLDYHPRTDCCSQCGSEKQAACAPRPQNPPLLTRD